MERNIKVRVCTNRDNEKTYSQSYYIVTDVDQLVGVLWGNPEARDAVEQYMFAGDAQAVQFGEANDIVNDAINRVEALGIRVDTNMLEMWLEYPLKKAAMVDMIRRGEWNNYCKTIKLEEVK